MNRKCLLLCIIFVGLFLVNFVFADTVYSNAVTTYYVEDTVNYTVQTLSGWRMQSNSLDAGFFQFKRFEKIQNTKKCLRCFGSCKHNV